MNQPSDRLAAFLAHCLNSEDLPQVRVDPGALYAQITEALATRYAQPLLHHAAYAWRMNGEEAALRYFESSLGRRLLLSGRVELSFAHRFFEALCHRGVEQAWSSASLQRELQRVGEDESSSPSISFEGCSERLSHLPDTISPGSASPTIRARSGAIVLRLGTLHALVPEEMSTWNAITCAPGVLKALSKGEQFNRFCGLVIDCVRTAHRPIQELLGLKRRLCPFDWLGVLSIQQVRALRQFLGALEDAGGKDAPMHWANAWEKAQVPGFKNAIELWQSEIGIALRNAPGERAVSLEAIAELGESDEENIELLSEEEFLQQIALLETDGIINSVERLLLTQLYRGAELSELKLLQEVKVELRLRRKTLEQLLADLERRIDQWPSRVKEDHRS